VFGAWRLSLGVWRLAFGVWRLASTYPRTSSLVVNTQYSIPGSAFVAIEINCAWSSRLGITICGTQITCQDCEKDCYLLEAFINRRFPIHTRFIPCLRNVWESVKIGRYLRAKIQPMRSVDRSVFHIHAK